MTDDNVPSVAGRVEVHRSKQMETRRCFQFWTYLRGKRCVAGCISKVNFSKKDEENEPDDIFYDVSILGSRRVGL